MDEKKQIVIHFEQFESDSKCPFTQHQLQIRLVERELLNDPECEDLNTMNIGAGDKGKIFWEEGMASLDIMVQFRVKLNSSVVGSISFPLQDIFIPRQDFQQWFTIFNTPYDDVFDGDIGLDEDQETPRILLGFEISDDLGEETQDHEEESGTLLENTTLRDLESNITESMAVPHQKGITSMDLGPTFDKKDYDTDYNLKSVQIEDLVGREQSSFGDFNLIPNYTIEDEVSEMLKMQGESFQTGQKINFQSDVEVMKSNAKSDVSVADSDSSKPGSIKNKFMSHHKDKDPSSNVFSLNSRATKQDWKKVDKQCPQEISIHNSHQNSIIEETVNLDSIVSEVRTVGYQSQASLLDANRLELLARDNEILKQQLQKQQETIQSLNSDLMNEKEEKNVLTETLGQLRLSKKELERQIVALKEQSELQSSVNSQQQNELATKTEKYLTMESKLALQEEQLEYIYSSSKGK